jgi:hypothetical protein
MNIMTNICSKCGVALDAIQGFCNLCGTAWTAGPTVASGPARSGVLKPLLIGVVVLLVLAVGAGGWLYARNHARPVSEVATARPIPAAGIAHASSSDAASNMKSCSLVSKEEMEQILGLKLKDLAAEQLTCQYRNDEGYMVEVETTWQGGKEAMEQAKIFNTSTFDLIPDLGDDAFFQAAGVMHVRKGDVYMIINSRIYPTPRETETLIANKALSSLAKAGS